MALAFETHENQHYIKGKTHKKYWSIASFKKQSESRLFRFEKKMDIINEGNLDPKGSWSCAPKNDRSQLKVTAREIICTSKVLDCLRGQCFYFSHLNEAW